MELVKYNGKICCYGISPKLDMQLDWSKAPYNWTLQFNQWPLKIEEAEAHNQVINWIRAGIINPMDFISDIIDFENILDAFKMVEEKRAKKKIIIKF
jgi:threonine dehydrogenase-like Zn-dependent dehydrogenase